MGYWAAKVQHLFGLSKLLGGFVGGCEGTTHLFMMLHCYVVTFDFLILYYIAAKVRL